tara:strand:- start:317 stop:895 length:579 start_codon:yes stop_codon:yes gene_type:complete
MSEIYKKSIKHCIFKTFYALCISIFISLSITSCAVPEFAKPSKVDRSVPHAAKDRARKNIDEGRGVSIKGMMGGNRKTTYEFSSSNPLWRASLEIIDFMPLTTVDYSGGIIITDWYSDTSNTNDSIKITVRFLSNEIQSNSVKIIVHNKKCKTSESCSINEIDSKIKYELQRSILTKAAQYDLESKKKKNKN